MVILSKSTIKKFSFFLNDYPYVEGSLAMNHLEKFILCVLNERELSAYFDQIIVTSVVGVTTDENVTNDQTQNVGDSCDILNIVIMLDVCFAELLTVIIMTLR